MSPSQQGQSGREGGRAPDHSRGRPTSSCPPHSRVSQGGRDGTGSQPGEADLVMSPSQQGQSGRGRAQDHSQGGRPRHVPLTAVSVREGGRENTGSQPGEADLVMSPSQQCQSGREGGRTQDHSRGRPTSSCPPHSRVSQGGRDGTGSQPGEADLVMSPSQQGQSGREGGRAQYHSRGRLTSSCPPHSRVSQGGREGGGTGSQPGEADLVMSPSQQGQSGREGGTGSQSGGRPRHVPLTAGSVREGGRAQDHSQGG